MLLSDLLDAYALARPIADNSRYQYLRTCRLFGEHLGRPARSRDLTPDTVSGWVRSLETSHSKASVAGHRGKLLVLWRWAARRGLAPQVDDVRRAPRPEPMPESWTLEQVRALVAACDEMRERVRGVPIDRYLRALVLTAYESGLRRSDFWRIGREQIHADGSLVIRQHKTGRPHVISLDPSTAALVLSLPGVYPLAWLESPRSFYRLWRRLLTAAGIQRGALHQLRRTGATYIARDHGTEAAARWLGHSTPGMHAYYVDRRIAQPPVHRPPREG